MARDGQTSACIMEGDPDSTKVPGYYMGREKVESPGARIGRKEEEKR